MGVTVEVTVGERVGVMGLLTVIVIGMLLYQAHCHCEGKPFPSRQLSSPNAFTETVALPGCVAVIAKVMLYLSTSLLVAVK